MSSKTVKTKARLAGFITGTVNGFFGGGGGMLAVPLMQSALSLTPKQAHATAIFLILPLSAVSGICYAMFGAFMKEGWWIALGVTVGGGVGAALLSRISENAAKTAFTLVMALSGLYLLLF